MNECLFCRIINGEIPSKKIYEDESVYAFYDIEPQAPVHFLVIPKEHIKGACDINEKNSAVVAKIFESIAKIAEELKLGGDYRVVTNSGEKSGQSVGHLHFHVLAGRNLSWPPG